MFLCEHSRGHKTKEEQTKPSLRRPVLLVPALQLTSWSDFWKKERDATQTVCGGAPYSYSSSEIILVANKNRETSVSLCVLKRFPWQNSKNILSFEVNKKSYYLCK